MQVPRTFLDPPMALTKHMPLKMEPNVPSFVVPAISSVRKCVGPCCESDVCREALLKSAESPDDCERLPSMAANSSTITGYARVRDRIYPKNGACPAPVQQDRRAVAALHSADIAPRCCLHSRFDLTRVSGQ